MTAQTVSQAIQKRDEGPAELVRQSRPWFATIVPSHIDAQAFVAMTIGYLRRQPKLAAAAGRNPASFIAALSECAPLGLAPGDTFHLVPFADHPRAPAGRATPATPPTRANGAPPGPGAGQGLGRELPGAPGPRPGEPETPPGAPPAGPTTPAAAPASEKTAPPGKPSKAATDRLAAALAQLPLGDDADRAVLITWQIGRASCRERV